MEVLFGDDRSLTNLDFGWDYFKAIWSTLDRFTETPTAELSMQLQIYQGAFQAEFALSVLGGYYGGVAVGFAERYIAARLTVAGTQAGGAALGSSAGVFGWLRQLFKRGGVNLTQNNIQHISKHIPENFAKQIEFIPQNHLSNVLSKRTFFNPNWSVSKIYRAVTKGYRSALDSGFTDGIYRYKIHGEYIELFLKNGQLDTAFGLHRLAIEFFK